MILNLAHYGSALTLIDIFQRIVSIDWYIPFNPDIISGNK